MTEIAARVREGPTPRTKTAFAFALAAAGLFFFHQIQQVVLLAFLGILLSVLLSTVADWGVHYLKMRRGPAVVVAGVLFLIVVAATIALMAVPIATQGQEFADSVPRMIEHVRDKIQVSLPWIGDYIQFGAPAPAGSGESAGKVARAAIHAGSAVFEGVVRALAAFFLGLFLAWDPDGYRQGVAEAWPGGGTVDEKVGLLERLADALKGYLLTVAIQIVVMAASWAVGLKLIGIDYWLLFGVIGGLVEVIPYVGPLLGLIPPLAVALGQDPTKALLVVGLYLVLHVVESYILIPWLLQREEHVPPPIVVVSILAFGTAFGTMGVFLALPLGTVIYVWVKDYLLPRRRESEARQQRIIEAPGRDFGGLAPGAA